MAASNSARQGSNPCAGANRNVTPALGVIHAGIAQRQSRGLPNRRSRVRFPLPAPGTNKLLPPSSSGTGPRSFKPVDAGSNPAGGPRFLLEHDLIRKPVPTFRDHALFGGGATGGAADFESAG